MIYSIAEEHANHIFRNAPGHLADTPANRNLLIATASNTQNLIGKDKYGNEWFTKTLTEGSQVWVPVRNGQIRNGGLNSTPRPFNLQTGLSRSLVPSPRRDKSMKILTTQEAFVAMRSFLEGYYERTKSDDVGALLGDMQLLGDGLTADPAIWEDWLICVEQSKINIAA